MWIIYRNNLDSTINYYEEILIDFLKDTKCCVIKGRIPFSKDNFTSVSVKGKVVVDYIIVPHECLNFCDTFCVFTPNDLIERLGGEGCKLPNHSLLWLKVQVGP